MITLVKIFGYMIVVTPFVLGVYQAFMHNDIKCAVAGIVGSFIFSLLGVVFTEPI